VRIEPLNQRLLNIRRVLTEIREGPERTRASLSRRLGLSKPTVSEITRILIDVGVVEEDGVRPSRAAGRRSMQLKIKHDAYCVLAIDVGGTNLRGAVVAPSGLILHRLAERTRSDDLEDQVCQLIDRLSGLSAPAEIIGVGIGAAGVADPQSGMILNMPALSRVNVELGRHVREATNLPVLVDNDVNYATLGEWWRGTASGRPNVACVSVGTGIGAGLILDHKLYRGSHNLVGEIGYAFHEEKLPEAPYARFGAMEHFASGWGLQQNARQSIDAGVATCLTKERLDRDGAHAILDASLHGDPLSRELVHRAGIAIGRVIANIISLLDLDRVVLTGGVMGTPDEILPLVRQVVKRVAVPEARDVVDICLGVLGDDAVLIGATYEVQESLLPELVFDRARNGD